ncbi:MAG: MFS transporter, partial [Chloroflexota bacterium]|nr:MFS transporter [Chloroflexota bacterium]
MRRLLTRDRRTFLLYAVMWVFGFSQSVVGSTTPFLRDELKYSTVEVGWHFTLYAAGVVAAGLAS